MYVLYLSKKFLLYAPKYSVKLKAHFDFLLIFVFENNVKYNEVIFIKLVNVPLPINCCIFCNQTKLWASEITMLNFQVLVALIS